MNRFLNSSANAFTLCVHLMLCTALVFVCSFGQTFFAEQSATAAHTVAQGTVATVVTEATAATHATAANEASGTVAFEANSEWTDDLAGDLPELMLSTGVPAASTATSYRLLGLKLGPLPHPFAERPQRPPQTVSLLV